MFTSKEPGGNHHAPSIVRFDQNTRESVSSFLPEHLSARARKRVHLDKIQCECREKVSDGAFRSSAEA